MLTVLFTFSLLFVSCSSNESFCAPKSACGWYLNLDGRFISSHCVCPSNYFCIRTRNENMIFSILEYKCVEMYPHSGNIMMHK